MSFRVAALALLTVRCCWPAPAQDLDTAWTRTYGGARDDVFFSMCRADPWGFVLAGVSNSYSPGDVDFWMMKVDCTGAPLWNTTRGGRAWDSCFVVRPTRDSGFVMAGSTRSYGGGSADFWIVKTTAAGDSEWSATFGGLGNQRCYGVTQTADDGYLLVGDYYPFLSDQSILYLVKVNPSGGLQWTASYQDTVNVYGRDVVATDLGYLAAGGRIAQVGEVMQLVPMVVVTTPTGLPVEEWSYRALWPAIFTSVQATRDSAYLLTTTVPNYTHGESGEWKESILVKASHQGVPLWTSPCGVRFDDEIFAAIETADSGALAVGSRRDSGAVHTAVFITRVNRNGDTLWTKTIGGPYDMQARAVVRGADGSYMVAGWVAAPGQGYDAWLAKLDSVRPDGIGPSSPLPAALKLAVHPNPFNARAEIIYDLPRAQRVSLRIYDTLGRELAVLADGFQSAGSHRASFDGSTLSSGLLFCRLQSDAGFTTQKLILLK